MKLTRHNGRSGKHGTYNPRHNDRRFDVENSEHIDAERARQNVYWDCYRGFTTHEFRENPEQPDFSFEEIERMFYYEHYGGHVEAQNARNKKTRHTERNRTVEDLLKNNKTCPEETLYQIGTMEQSVPPEVLFQIVTEFQEEFDRRFGPMSISLIGRFIWTKPRPTFMSGTSLTVRTATGNCVPNRRRRWKNLASLSQNRTSAKAGTITASRPLMPSAGHCFLTSAAGMVCIWIRSRPTAGGTIWKSRIIS